MGLNCSYRGRGMYCKGKKMKAYFPSCSEQIRCYKLLWPYWELLCSPSQLKRTRNNGRRWIHGDMIKSRKMILYTAVLKQLHTASCLSVSPSKKVTEQAKIFCLMSSSASHQGCGDPKTKSRISDWTCFTMALQIFPPPNILPFHPTTIIIYRNYWKTWQPL